MRHPQLRHVAVATAGGDVELVAPPALGEHAAAVRAEFA